MDNLTPLELAMSILLSITLCVLVTIGIYKIVTFQSKKQAKMDMQNFVSVNETKPKRDVSNKYAHMDGTVPSIVHTDEPDIETFSGPGDFMLTTIVQ